jgi:glycosyltransferase involved in cell wall biosynthesis
MKILSIGSDRKLFEEDSPVRIRQSKYAESFKELHIVVFSKSGLSLKDTQISPNCFVYPTNSWSPWFYALDAIKIGVRVIKKDKFKSEKWVITCQDPFESGYAGMKIANKMDKSLQVQIHTDFFDERFKGESIKNKIRLFLAKSVLPKADCIRVVNQDIAESLKSQGWNLKSEPTVLPVFVDVEKIKNSVVKTDLHKKYPQFGKIILMASRLTKEKNIGLAIEAFGEVLEDEASNFNPLLLIIGSGPQESGLNRKAEEQDLESNVLFEPWTEDLISYYKTADLFLLTSEYEGYGRTLIEAAASGCKIISSDVGISRKLLPKENVFPINDKETLKEKLRDAIKGEIKPANEIKMPSEEEYLNLYKSSFERCAE